MKSLLYFNIILLTFTCILSACQEASKYRPELNTQEAKTQLEQAARHEAQNNPREAFICYWNAIEKLQDTQTPDTLTLTAETYCRLGNLMIRYGLLEKAVACHRKSFHMADSAGCIQLRSKAALALSDDYQHMNQPDTAAYFRTFGSQTPAPQIPTNKRTVTTDVATREKLSGWIDRYLECRAEQSEAARGRREARRHAGMASASGLVIICLLAAYGKKRRNEQRLYHLLQCEQTHTAVLQAEQTRQETTRKKLNDREKLLDRLQAELMSDTHVRALNILERIKNHPCYQPVQSNKEWDALKLLATRLHPVEMQAAETARNLTPRDREIHCLDLLGFTSGQMAIFYGISSGSITKAKSRIREKMKVSIGNDRQMSASDHLSTQINK